MQLDKVKLVMDRGFYSADNINSMYKNHYKFLIGGKLSLSFVKKKLDSIRTELVTRKNYYSEAAIFAETHLQEWPYEETKPRSGEQVCERRRIYVHYYYNDQKATDDRMRFYHELDQLEEELRSGQKKPESEKEYDKYFIVSDTPVRGRKIKPKQEAIDVAEKNFGFFVLMSNGINDPMEALKIYRTKDLIEKAFGNLKEHLNMRRESVASEGCLEGKLFIQFIALIYLCYIKKVMDEKRLFSKYSIQELLDELDIIELYQQPGNRAHIGEITGKQQALYEAMGVKVPT